MITDSYPAGSSAIPEHPDQPARQGTKRTSLTRAVAIAVLGLLGTTCGKFIDDPTDPIIVGAAPTGAAGLDLNSVDQSDHGFNPDAKQRPFDAERPNVTNSLPLNFIQGSPEDPHPARPASDALPEDRYREIVLDANEENRPLQAQFCINAFDLWLFDETAAAECVEGDLERHRPEAR